MSGRLFMDIFLHPRLTVVYKFQGTPQPRLGHVRGFEDVFAVSHYVYVYGDVAM